MRLGAYQTLVNLGRGGMADLYLARADFAFSGCRPGEGGSPLVILKTLRGPQTPSRVAMFVDEARLALLFDHPNVVQAFSAGHSDEGRHFIALEYLDGHTLDRVYQRAHTTGIFGRADVRAVFLYILARALGGLHYAHELTCEGTPLLIVHRDFTPQNLFVTYEGRVKALDFGIAKAKGRVFRTTSRGEVKGKLRYMAPEQALGLRVDRRADIFSAGVMLYELVAGTSFWSSMMSDNIVFDELVGGNYRVEVPHETVGINAILKRALARDACERYRTADEMRIDLLKEIRATFSILSELSVMTASLVSSLFQAQRERTTQMLAHAKEQSDMPLAASAPPSSASSSPSSSSSSSSAPPPSSSKSWDMTGTAGRA
jgi:eukaryotic-like serine/threonine-protein kinase